MNFFVGAEAMWVFKFARASNGYLNVKGVEVERLVCVTALDIMS